MEEEINTIATSVIAFSTVLGIGGTFYYNLLVKYSLTQIIFFELLLFLSVLIFILYIKGKVSLNE